MSSNSDEKSYKPVQSIERTFKILEVLAKNPEGLSLLALSEQTGLPSSTVHRLLHTLFALGYTEWRSSNSSPYKLTLRLFEYGCYSVENRTFIQKAPPFIKRLSEELKMSVSVFLPNRHNVVCAMKSTESSVPGGPRLGECIPMHCCAAGKCILSRFDEKKLDHYMSNITPTMYTPKTKTALETLTEDIDQIRRQGWALVDEEYRMGEACIAVPLSDRSGVVIGAMGIQLLSGQFTQEQTREWVECLKQYAQLLMPIQ